MNLARTPKQIGAIIRRQRSLVNLSQTELGRRAGVRQATISEIEAGRPTSRISIVCDVLAALDLELTIAPRSKGTSTPIEEIF